MAIVNTQPKNFQFWNVISATPNDFTLDAGAYGLTLHASVWGTATLRKLLPDGVTYVLVANAVAADGFTFIEVPAGQYQLTLAGVTGLIGEIAKIVRGS